MAIGETVERLKIMEYIDTRIEKELQMEYFCY